MKYFKFRHLLFTVGWRLEKLGKWLQYRANSERFLPLRGLDLSDSEARFFAHQARGDMGSPTAILSRGYLVKLEY